MRNRIITAIFISFITLSMTACNNSTGSSSESPASAIKSDSTPSSISVADKEMIITLTIWDETELSTETVERTGTYSGDTVENIPNGIGTFKTQSADGEPWYYEGEFKDGTFNGHGKSVWPVAEGSDEKEYSEIGTYENGLFTPTKSELIGYLGGIELYGEFTISEETATFIDAHENLFPTQTEADLQDLESFVDRTIEYKHLTKSLTNYLSCIVEIDNANVIQIFEDPYAGHTITSMLIQDQDWNHFVVYFDRSIDVYQGDHISIFGLPVASSFFENVSGGITNNIVLYGCSII